MDQPFIGMIAVFGFNFAPTGWALCNGQLLSISQNTALFALIGTTYGGDGIQTFGLPNLQGRAPNHQGQIPGGSNYVIGQVNGHENATLLAANMPTHNHLLMGIQAESDATHEKVYPGPLHSFGPAYTDKTYSDVVPATHSMHPSSMTAAGSSLPFDNLSPYLTTSYCIALQGVFPSRN